ncbi:hypothetical protein [Desulforhopalus singaporensis]|uniref:Lysine biosynthesis protein LysW n=1 Tax=Desulforhopalus singaporensis TaxID=91360 RepID=A0A1H0UHC5_9BACT|nr:hypothetical protein [Desulforhopalus singaporensis]SDP65617.1 hypothetical protein SAMN05660330_03562 [Desulforhopalus singaporensis]
MATTKKQRDERERFGKCQICLCNIPVEYYFDIGDEIICYECGTEYTISSTFPVKLQLVEDSYGGDDFFGEELFDDY